MLSEMKLKVGLPVRMKLKMEKMLENGFEIDLPEGVLLMLLFYNCSWEVDWE